MSNYKAFTIGKQEEEGMKIVQDVANYKIKIKAI